MYWLCFPLLLIVMFLGVAAINNFLALVKDDDDEEEDEDDADSEGEGGGGDNG